MLRSLNYLASGVPSNMHKRASQAKMTVHTKPFEAGAPCANNSRNSSGKDRPINKETSVGQRHTGMVMRTSDDLIVWVRIQCAAAFLSEDEQHALIAEIRRLLDDLH